MAISGRQASDGRPSSSSELENAMPLGYSDTDAFELYQMPLNGAADEVISRAVPGDSSLPSEPAAIPEAAWDVFLLDEDESPGEPDPGDFWVEADSPDDE